MCKSCAEMEELVKKYPERIEELADTDEKRSKELSCGLRCSQHKVFTFREGSFDQLSNSTAHPSAILEPDCSPLDVELHSA